MYEHWKYDTLRGNLAHAYREYVPGLFNSPVLTVAQEPQSRERLRFWLHFLRLATPLSLLLRFVLA